ncbi:MAG: ester cyclase [Thermoplasmata archaeon]
MKPTTESNRTVVRRFIEELWNRGDLSRIDEIVAPNFVMHDAPGAGTLTGSAGVRKEFEVERSLYPDEHFQLEEMIAEGDLVACRTTLTGTPPNQGGAHSASARKVTLRGMNFFRLSDGKITDEWWVYDSSEKWWVPPAG